MTRENTKTRIALAALELFSEKGFDGVGIDQIASAVGIRGASIYAHYRGKEDILNTIIDMMEDYYKEQFGNLDNIGELPSSIDSFREEAMRRISFTMNDAMITRVRKLCSNEQFRNKRLAGLTSAHQLKGNISMYSAILSHMMNIGLIVRDNAELLALELIAPVTVALGIADREPERKDEMLRLTGNHLDHFIGTYRIKE